VARSLKFVVGMGDERRW